jgi:hypothetical protein
LVLKEGQPEEDFVQESGEPQERILGGSWYSKNDLLEAGYGIDPAFNNVKITSGHSAEKFNKRAAEHIKEGRKVVAVYGALAIGGWEGYASLAVNPPPLVDDDSEKRRRIIEINSNLRALCRVGVHNKVGKKTRGHQRLPTRIQPKRTCKK